MLYILVVRYMHIYIYITSGQICIKLYWDNSKTLYISVPYHSLDTQNNINSLRTKELYFKRVKENGLH